MPVVSIRELLGKRNGYLRRFVAGKAVERSALPPDASRSSLLGWAYTAVPVPGSGERGALCVDSTGRICRYPGNPVLRLTRAECPLPCERVE